MTKEQLKQVRIDLGMTQRDFAKAIGKNYRTIQRMETGEYPVWAGVEAAVKELMKGK